MEGLREVGDALGVRLAHGFGQLVGLGRVLCRQSEWTDLHFIGLPALSP